MLFVYEYDEYISHLSLGFEVNPGAGFCGVFGKGLEEVLVLLIGDFLLLSRPDSDVVVDSVPSPNINL